MRIRRIMAAALLVFSVAMPTVAEQVHTINAQARVFVPDTVYIEPGDTVKFVNMISHNTESVEGLIPEGAEHWKSDLGINISLTLETEGVYGYVCVPHIGFGMVGVIVVGEPVNIDAAMEHAKTNLEGPYRRIIGKLLKVQRAARKG